MGLAVTAGLLPLRLFPQHRISPHLCLFTRTLRAHLPPHAHACSLHITDLAKKAGLKDVVGKRMTKALVGGKSVAATVAACLRDC